MDVNLFRRHTEVNPEAVRFRERVEVSNNDFGPMGMPPSMKGEPDQMPVDTAVDMICSPTFDGPLSEPSICHFQVRTI